MRVFSPGIATARDASLDPRILKDKIDQPGFIDLEHLVFITEPTTQADLFYWEFCDLELHTFLVALGDVHDFREFLDILASLGPSLGVTT